jgi:tetratricopeptide (TPR) repeat protein
MSLIMDALKKAQQLQLKGSERSPILKHSHPDQKKGDRSKKQWILVGAGFVFLCIVLFILIKPASPPLATQSNQTMVLMERKPSVPVLEKISTEPLSEVLIPSEDEEPSSTIQALNRMSPKQTDIEESLSIGAALKDQPFTENKLSLNKKKEESLIKNVSEEEKLKTQGKVMAEKSLRPSPPSQQGESPSKSIEVEQEGGKDGTLTSEALTHFNSGVHFYKQREFSKAIQAYQKVIEVDPTYIEAYNNLGIIYQMLGDVDKAFGFYQKSTEINPRYEKGYNNLGILLFLKGHYEEAQEAFQKSLTMNSNNIESHINLGTLFKKKGELEKAIGSYQSALAINPLHSETHYNIALLYEQLENLELAISHYQQFIQLSLKSHPDLVSKVKRHLNYLVETRRSKK